jgi:hypothetical protein
MDRLVFLGGVSLAAGLGILLAQALTFPGMLFGGCTEVGVPPDQQGGLGFLGVEGADLLYTPDGVNECRIPLVAVLLPVGLVVAGTGIVPSAR